MDKYADQEGFKVNHSYTNKKDEDDGSKVTIAGRFYCNQSKKSCLCPWKVNFGSHTFPDATIPFCYKINGSSCFHHTHELCKVIKKPSSNYKWKKEHLTETEIELIRCMYRLKPSNIIRVLSEMNHYEYAPKLISRIKSEYIKKKFGFAAEGWQNLREKKRILIESGGSFNDWPNDDLSLKCFCFQTADMKSMNDKYNDYVLHDGTFGTNVFNLTLIPTVVVDCFGRSQISSVMTAPTESSECIINMAEYMDLFKEGSTYHTDEGRAYPLVASYFQLNHKLCYHHFMNNVETSDLNQAESITFRNEVAELLCKQFNDQYGEEMSRLLIKYKDHPSIVKYLSQLDKKKDMLCFHSAGRFFCAGAISNQR